MKVQNDPITVFDYLPYTSKEVYRSVLTEEAFATVGGAPFVTDFSSGSVAKSVVRICRSSDDLCEQEITESTFSRVGVGSSDCFVCIDVGAAGIYDFYFRAARNLGVARAIFLHLTAEVAESVRPLHALQPTVLLTLPSLLIRMWPHLRGLWKPGACPIRVLFMMGEHIDTSFRTVVESVLGCKIFSFYGTTEIGGLAGECKYQNGHHFNPHFVLPSIKSPTYTASESIEGEVLFTTLHEHTHSVIKYEVGDMVRISLAPCKCGEPSPRLWFLQRTTEAFILAGEKFSYSMFFAALSDKVPDIKIMSLEILENGARGNAVTLSFYFPIALSPYENVFYDVLKNEIFGLDSLYRYGFVDFKISFKPVTNFGGRKIKRLIDHRSEAAA